MITLFLGAGASKPFGYPTTQDFMQFANRSFKNNTFYSDIISFLQTKKEIVDIEKVVWEIDTLLRGFDETQETDTFKRWFFIDSNRLFYKTGQNSWGGIADLIKNTSNQALILKSDIDKLVYDTYWKETNIDASIYYKKLFERLEEEFLYEDDERKRQINLFTTNYDLLIEKILGGEKQEEFSDGFDSYQRLHFYWDLKHYGNSRIKLFKLHGSLDWKRFGSDDKVYRIPGPDFTKHEDNIILYPGFKGTPTEEPFISLHNQFEKALKSSVLCIFIGFSFRDKHINEIIGRAAKENSRLVICNWNPQTPHWQDIDPDIKSGFSQYEKNFGEDLKCIEEFFEFLRLNSVAHKLWLDSSLKSR